MGETGKQRRAVSSGLAVLRVGRQRPPDLSHLQLQSGSSRLQDLFGLGSGRNSLRRDITRTTHHALLTLAPAIGLQRCLDDTGSVGRTVVLDETKGHALDAMPLISGSKEVFQQGTCGRLHQQHRHERSRMARVSEKTVDFVCQIPRPRTTPKG